MKNRLVLRAMLVVCAIVLSTLAYAVPNQEVAPFEGACGYMPYVTSPPYYWTGTAVSYSQCINVDLPALVAQVQSQGFTIVEASCRPAKYCGR
jgi:hypothetical protein